MQGQKSTGQTSRWLLLGWSVILLIGCAPIRSQPPGAPEPQATQVEAEPEAGASEPTLDGFELSVTNTITQENTMTITLPSANPQVEQAMKDLARRLALSLDQIMLVSAEAVAWPDAGLGCPQPGMVYAQVMQDGMRIILSAGGQEYHYHSGETRAPFLCENPAS